MIKNGSLVGYCPNCNLPIASFDLTNRKKGVYTCSGCGEEKKLALLLKERKVEPKFDDSNLFSFDEEIS